MGIILAGGGNATQSLLVDAFYRHRLASGRREADHSPDIAFIAHAISPHTWDWDKSTEWLTRRDAMKDVSVTTIRDIEKEISLIESARSIFIMGGNTFRLLDELKKSRLLERLGALSDAKLIYGISAGAIIHGDSIKSAELGSEADPNEIGLQDMAGANLLEGMNVFTHFRQADVPAAKRFAESENRPCICISEEGGGFWEAGELRNIGADEIRIVCPHGLIVSLPSGGSLHFTT